MNKAVDHVCVAEHCVACCPTAQGYSAGFSDAKTWYSSERGMRLLDGPPIEALLILALLITCAVLVYKIRGMQRDNATK